MDGKVKLNVLGLSTSQIKQGAYTLLLAQDGGPYHLPIVIGVPEAQSIHIRMQGITPPRPLTHDIFESFTHAFGIRLLSVFIYKFEQGIFYSEMTFTDGEREVVIDCRTSDAVAIAIRTKSPIYTTMEILQSEGFVFHDLFATIREITRSVGRADDPDEEEQSAEPRLENYTVEELRKQMDECITREEYEKAAEIKRILDQKTNK